MIDIILKERDGEQETIKAAAIKVFDTKDGLILLRATCESETRFIPMEDIEGMVDDNLPPAFTVKTSNHKGLQAYRDTVLSPDEVAELVKRMKKGGWQL